MLSQTHDFQPWKVPGSGPAQVVALFPVVEHHCESLRSNIQGLVVVLIQRLRPAGVNSCLAHTDDEHSNSF